MEEIIENEEQYQNAVKEIQQLDGAAEGSKEEKRLHQLYALVETYEDRSRPETKLFTLKRKMAKYSDREVIVYRKMASQYIEYGRKVKAGEKAKKPDFDPELIKGMREWALLEQEISKLERLEEQA